MVAYFLRSWWGSIEFIVFPRSLKIFLLVTLKSIIFTYKQILLYFGWLFLLGVICEAAIQPSLDVMAYGEWPEVFLHTLPDLVWFMWVCAVFLACRPSVALKNFSYYVSNYKVYFYFLFFFCIAEFANRAFVMMSDELDIGMRSLLSFLSVPGGYIPYYLSPLFAFFILFMLDSDGSIASLFRSVWRGLKMVLYNYPFCALFVILFQGFEVISLLQGWYTGSAKSVFIIVMALVPIPLCIITNFYIKRLHDQFKVYFPGSVKE